MGGGKLGSNGYTTSCLLDNAPNSVVGCIIQKRSTQLISILLYFFKVHNKYNQFFFTGCDLWEEVRSNNFYFNRAGYIYSLNVAADFADKIGEARGEEFRTKANEILGFTKDHYGKFGDFIYEAENRPYDGAVIHSIATFGMLSCLLDNAPNYLVECVIQK